MAHVFHPEVLETCAQRGIGLPIEEGFDAITAELARQYPEHIETGPRRWILNNAGGAMGQICLLHCSLTEYLLFFGSPIGTQGHSGRYGTHVYDWVFKGEMWCYHPGDTERTVFQPGETAYLGSNQVKGYRVLDNTWMLEYARGAIPSMLPFALADTVMSTLDFQTLGRSLTTYTKQVGRSLIRGKI